MSSNTHPNCSCWNCVETRRQDAKKSRDDLIDFAKTGAPPALVENVTHRIDPSELEIALRDREASFSEDVLPAGATVLPPRELYGKDMWPRAVPRMHEQTPWSAVEAAKDETHPRRDWHGVPDKAFVGKGCAACSAYICARCDGARPSNLNRFACVVHLANQHWWHDPSTGAKLDRNMGEMLMLVVSEIAECMEGERKDLMDDHLPHRKMAEVELADAVIRIADIAGAKEYDISGGGYFEVPENKGHALHRICRTVLKVTLTHNPRQRGVYLGYAVAAIEAYAKKHGYDLWGAVAEKREYNRHRADHKPAARLAAGGKKF